MIRIENLVKRFGEKTAVDNVSFTVEEGEIVGFLGPNGAGKSTTMNILTGYLSSTSGRAFINDKDVLESPMEAKKLIGFLPEQPPLYLDMTVREYLNFVYDLKGCTLNRKKHIEEICEVVQIKEVYPRLIRNLSKGYRQRVGIAQALIGNPKVVIFDEPTVGLDPRQIIEIRDLIRRLGRDHTVILSTHILPEAQAVCDRIVVINEGKIVANERREDLQTLIGGNRRFEAHICGPKAEIMSAIRQIPGVSAVESRGGGDLDSLSYVIECRPGEDARKMIFNRMASAGWPIVSLTALGVTLEDIFISLVDRPKDAKGKKPARVKLNGEDK